MLVWFSGKCIWQSQGIHHSDLAYCSEQAAEKLVDEMWKDGWSVRAAVDCIRLVLSGDAAGCPPMAAAAIIKLVETFLTGKDTLESLKDPMLHIISRIVKVRSPPLPMLIEHKRSPPFSLSMPAAESTPKF